MKLDNKIDYSEFLKKLKISENSVKIRKNEKIEKNKKVLWISQLSQLEFNNDGMPVGFSITGRDITEKHHAEIALKNSEERLADAQELAHLGSWDENHKTDSKENPLR